MMSTHTSLASTVLFLTIVLSTSLRAQSESVPVVGVVNGDTIWVDSFSREVGRRAQMNELGGSATSADILQSTWILQVDDLLISQAAVQRGIAVTDAEVDNILLRETPDFVRRGIVDEKGRFDYNLLEMMLKNPEKLLEVQGKGLTPAQRERQLNLLKQSVAQLRERVRVGARNNRLQGTIYAETPIDEEKVFDQYLLQTTRAIADIIYLSCPAVTAEPQYSEIETWYDKFPDRYVSEAENRRLATLSWALEASPLDSIAFLRDVSLFVSELRSARSPEQQDSLWRKLSTSRASGSTVLHPDSVDQKIFYQAVDGRQTREVTDPVLHESGLHIFLVDSVTPTSTSGMLAYSARVLVLEFGPSRETIDSLLTEVRAAKEHYESGKSLGQVALLYKKDVDLSDYFTRDGKVYDSYRLANMAFSAQLAQMLDLVDAAETGFTLGVVADSIPPGLMPLGAVKDDVARDWKIDMACIRMSDRARTIYDLVTILEDKQMFVGVPIPDATIMRDIEIQALGLIGESIIDPLAAEAICDAPKLGLKGPFRGDAGWYVANIKSVFKSTREDFDLYSKLHGDELMIEQREQHWKSWLQNLRDSATIEDFRSEYFRY